MATSYLAVLKAAYDYEPQGDDEIAIKENQLVFLLERTDEEYVIPRITTRVGGTDGV
jgi:hypothetical protein